MRIRYKILIGLVVVIIGIVITFSILIHKAEAEFDVLMEEEIETLDLSLVDDGIYEGRYRAFPISVILNVTIENHLITQIEIVKHFNGQGDAAEVIVDDVISNQSLDVDFISGATYSSKVILLAIQDAFDE